jgi:hypothetical protein
VSVVSLEQLVYQGLIATPGFVELLALDAGGNVAFYDKQLPQQNFPASGSGVVYPAGVYQRISSLRLFAHGAGTSQASTGLARFQLTFWSNAPNGTVVLNQIDLAVRGFFQSFIAMYSAGSPVLANPSFVSYNSKTGIEPQTQPTLQTLIIDVQFWFSE